MNLPEIYEPLESAPQLMGERRQYQRSGDDQITVGLLLAMLRRRLTVLLVTLAVCVVLGFLWTSSTPGIYRSFADVVLITSKTDVVPNVTTAAVEGPIRAEEVETQIQLIESREMAGQVFDELRLQDDDQFRSDILQPKSTVDNILSTIGIDRNRSVPLAAHDAERFRERAISYMMRALDVTRVGTSYNLRISVTDFDARRAALFANTYARLFTTDDARLRAQRNETAGRVLASRLAELRQQANSDYAAVQAYRIRNDLLSTSATALTEQEISTYNQQIAGARAEAARDAAALASARSQLRSGGPDSVGQGTSSQVVSSLRSQRSQLTTREADLVERYTSNHPDLMTVREQIAGIDRQIAAEVNREIHALESAATTSAQRLSSLLASRSGTRAQLQGDNSALVQLADLERSAEASQALYQSYLERYNEVVAGSGSEQPSARMISGASVPVLPVSPNWPLNMALAAVVGVLLGGMLAITSELSYRGLTTLDDVENRLGLLALGFVPAFGSIKPHSSSALDTVRDYPDSAFAESLRNVVVSIGGGNGRCKVVAFTSAIPGEGKTTLASCLGRTIAMSNERVVIIDCDVVRAQLSRQFGFSNGEPGLHEALNSPAGEIVQYKEADSSLQVIPITKPFRKGERLIEGGRLHRLVARLREDYDYILLDCPPILPIAESRELVALADCAVLVVRWRSTMDKVVRAAIKLLPMRILKDVGVVLNGVDMRKHVRFGGSDAASFYKQYEAYYT